MQIQEHEKACIWICKKCSCAPDESLIRDNIGTELVLLEKENE